MKTIECDGVYVDVKNCPFCEGDDIDIYAIDDTGPDRGTGFVVSCLCGGSFLTGLSCSSLPKDEPNIKLAAEMWNRRK